MKNIFNRPFLIIMICIIISVIAFYLKFGFLIINPENNGWLMAYDYAPHYLGWLFFSSEPWGFPLGDYHNLFHPLGTNIGYTDSIPLMALIGKAFRFVLSDQSQYLGFWLFLSYILQGLFSGLIVNRMKTDLITKILMATLLVFSPVLLNRYPHPALCVHWLILAGIWLYMLTNDNNKVRRIHIWLFVFNFIAAFIHPYISPMLLLLSAAVLFKLSFVNKFIRKYKAIIVFVLLVIIVFLSWFIIGYFGISDQKDYGATGYGWFSINLNTLYNSNNGSSFSFMNFPIYSDGQRFEGCNYMGLGLLILLAGTIIYSVFNFRKFYNKKNLYGNSAIILVMVFFTLFSLTHIVTFNSKELFSFKLPYSVEVLLSPFRSSGRFFWVTYYLLIVISFIIFSKIIQKYKSIKYLLILITALQLYDIKPLYSHIYFESGNYSVNETVVKWEKILEPFDHVITYPPFEQNITSRLSYVPLSYICARNNKTISTGYIARYDKKSAQEYRDELEAAMKSCHFDENTVYLAHIKYYDLFNEGLSQKKLKVSVLDSVLIFYSEIKETEILKNLSFDGKSISIDRFIMDYSDEIIFISVKDEATNSFKESTKAIFRDMNIPIDEFKYRGSFACVLHKGNSIFYKIGNADSVSVNFTKDSIVGDITFRKNVKLVSKGFDAGNYSSIFIDGTEHSVNTRGFNIVVTDTAFNVIKSVNFDTHKPFE